MIVAQVNSNDCGYICSLVAGRTDNQGLGQLVGLVASQLASVLLIWALAFVTIKVIRKNAPRAESAWVKRQVAEAKRLSAPDQTREQQIEGDLRAERAGQRAETMRTVGVSVLAGIIWTMAILIGLDKLGLNLAPLLAGAGVVGIALGFGAQSMVQDFLAGLFIVIEDQFGVGDVVDLGDAIGTVEQVNLRSTRLRDVSGVVWYVPNGQILRVGNMSQLWSKAVLDVSVGYDTDLVLAQEVLQRVAEQMWREDDTSTTIIERPAVMGVERFEADGIIIRLVVKTEPTEQWAAARELRLRIKEGLDSAGIEIPFPQRSVHMVQN